MLIYVLMSDNREQLARSARTADGSPTVQLVGARPQARPQLGLQFSEPARPTHWRPFDERTLEEFERDG